MKVFKAFQKSGGVQLYRLRPDVRLYHNLSGAAGGAADCLSLRSRGQVSPKNRKLLKP